MVSVLKILLGLVWLGIVYFDVSTILKTDLNNLWSYLITQPWVRIAILDYYVNVLMIYLWVLYRERSMAPKILCAILFFFLGSVASLAYILVQLFALREDEGIDGLFNRKAAKS